MRGTVEKNYGTQLEFFAAFLFKKIFNDLKGQKIKSRFGELKIGNLMLEGSPSGGEQLTDIPLTLYLENDDGQIKKLFIYIESKAYLAGKDVSEDELIGSVSGFYRKKNEFIDKGYGDCYIIFKPGNANINKGGKLFDILNKYCKSEDFVDHWFELSKDFFSKNEIATLCTQIKNVSNNKFWSEYENKIIEDICNKFIVDQDLSLIKDIILSEISVSIEKYETSPKNLNSMLEYIKNNIDKEYAKNIIINNKIIINNGFLCNDHSLIKAHMEDIKIAKIALADYISSKYAAFDIGYIFKYIEKFEEKISQKVQLQYLESYNPIKNLSGDFVETIDKFLDKFKADNPDIINTIIRKDITTILGLVVYLGALKKGHIKYEDGKKDFITGSKFNA